MAALEFVSEQVQSRWRPAGAFLMDLQVRHSPGNDQMIIRISCAVIGVVLVSGCSRREDQSADEVVGVSPEAVLDFASNRLQGKVVWNAEMRAGQLTDSLQLHATGRDAEGRVHSLDGTVELTGRGGWDGNSVVFSHMEELSSGVKLGLVAYDLVELTPTAQEHLNALSFVPVEYDFVISEQGTKVDGRITLHPETAALRQSGKDPLLETALTIHGDIGLRTCTVFAVDQGRHGAPTAEIIVAGSHRLCDERFGGP